MGRGTFGRVLGALAFAYAISATPAPAIAQAHVTRSHVTMPFTCSMATGRVKVVRGHQQSYRIVGAHDQQAFTACPPHAPERCRTWMIHRFDLDCGGTRVAWTKVVAAAMGEISDRVALEGGRLLLAMGPRPAVHVRQEVRPCEQHFWRTVGPSGPVLRPVPPEPDCGRPQRPAGWPPMIVEFPSGFAPVMQLEARFTASPPAAEPPVKAPAAKAPIQIGDTAIATPDPTAGGGPEDRVDAEAARLDPSPGVSTSPLARPGPTLPVLTRPAQPLPSDLPGAPPSFDIGALAEHTSRPGDWVTETRLPAPDSRLALRWPRAPLVSPLTGMIGVMLVTALAALAWRRQQRPAPAIAQCPPDLRLVETPWSVQSAHVPPAAPRPVEAEPVVTPPPLFATGHYAPNGHPAAQDTTGGTTAGATAAASHAPDQMRQTDEVRQPRDKELAELATACAELIRSSDRLHQRALEAVRRLGAKVERTALDAELAAVEASLLDPELTRLSAARQWDAVRARMQGVLGRLAEIDQQAEAVARRAGALPTISGLPTTREEAIAVLGVNATAETRIVKKVVDALRQCWHPDLAGDEADRAIREARLKQINVAWDLIAGRRAPG